MKKGLVVLLVIFNSLNTQAQNSAENALRNCKSGDLITISEKISPSTKILISGKQNLEIKGIDETEIVSFNNIPSIIHILNCDNVNISNIKLRYGVKDMGGPIIIIEKSKNIHLDGLTIGGFGKQAILIDSLTSGVKITNCKIRDCQDSGIKTFSSDVEIKNNSFSNNSEIGRFLPDLDAEVDNGFPLLRYNEYRVSDYAKQKSIIDQFAESKNSLASSLDYFKILKKYNLPDGSEGKLTAFYEGENNKILDKIELEYKGPKGQITARMYYLHENMAYSEYEIRKGKIDINYFAYGDFLDHLVKSNLKSAAHVSGTPSENRIQFDQWLKTVESWLDYIKSEQEEFELYENKDSFIALPY